MGDKYASKYLSTTYSQKLESNPEALSELTSRQIKRQSASVWLISLFLFFYFLLALGIALLESTESLFTLDYWALVENLAAAAVHVVGMLAAALGFYCTKVLEFQAAKRFAMVLAVALGIYAGYLITWIVICYSDIIKKLIPAFNSSHHPEVRATQLLVVLFLFGAGVAGYFIYCAYRLKETLETWKALNPRKDVTVRSLSMVLDK